jgi:molybdopterin molybdotransferase
MVMTVEMERATRTDVAWADARRYAHAAGVPAAPVRVALGAAAGLVLAADLVAAGPLPGFDTAAMDGYAVAGPGPWRLVGRARPGSAFPGRLADGCAVEIATGAVVPAGARAVLPVESAVSLGDAVRGPQLPTGRHIRRAGEDAVAGTRLVPAGTPIGPAVLGLAAACGYDELPAYPAPIVRAVVTGDELVHRGQPAPGRIRDALGPLLPSLVAELGGDFAGLVHVTDRPAEGLGAAVEAAGVAGADVVVVTGSTSVGAGDGLRRLLTAERAEWIVDAVACRPGHPQVLARLHGGPFVVGLPGNPFAALVAAHTVLGPLLAGLSGRGLRRLPEAPLLRPVPVLADRTRIIPVRWDGRGVVPLGGDRPAFLNGAALGDALAAIAPGSLPGDPVPLISLR